MSLSLLARALAAITPTCPISSEEIVFITQARVPRAGGVLLRVFGRGTSGLRIERGIAAIVSSGGRRAYRLAVLLTSMGLLRRDRR